MCGVEDIVCAPADSYSVSAYTVYIVPTDTAFVLCFTSVLYYVSVHIKATSCCETFFIIPFHLSQ